MTPFSVLLFTVLHERVLHGFSDDAQDFAIAHQISLIDLSGESFEALRIAVYTAAQELWRAAREHRVQAFPLTWTRRTLRLILGTADQIQVPEIASNAPVFLSQAQASLQGACKFGDLRGRFAPGLMAGRVCAGYGVAFLAGGAGLMPGAWWRGFQVTAGLLFGSSGVIRPRSSIGSR